MRKQRVWLTISCMAYMAVTAAVAQGMKSPIKDCGDQLPPGKTVNGKKVGPTICGISSEQIFESAQGVRFRRLEVGISGTIEGYTPKNPSSRVGGYFSDVPEFTIAQRGDLGPYAHAIGMYLAERGSGMTLFVPESASGWNGKLYVLAHGSAQYPSIGEMLKREKGQYNRYMGKNSYAGIMIDKGYAVAYTRRSGTKFGSRGGTESVTFDDGTIGRDKAYDYHVGLLKDFTLLAHNILAARLGQKPSRTYWWGHSAGAALGHLMNYVPDANVGPNGKRLFDGFLDDDPGGGLYLPVIYFEKQGDAALFKLTADTKDHLKFDDAHKGQFGYQIDIVHQAYAGNDYVLGDYLSNKRQNARVLLAKGLGDRIRTYEIVGVSHGDAGGNYPGELADQNLDLSGLFDALVDSLDEWAERGTPPSATRSDAYDLGDVDKDGRNENAAVELPEIACPLGVYYEFPEGVKTPGRTGFAAYLKEAHMSLNADTEPIPPGYEKAWLEPLDSRGYVLDMNKNTARDTRDSLTQAWRRRMAAGKKYGVLSYSETLTHDRYVGCVTTVANELLKQRLLSQDAVNDYVRKAEASDVGRTVSEKDTFRAIPIGTKPADIPTP